MYAPYVYMHQKSGELQTKYNPYDIIQKLSHWGPMQMIYKKENVA